MWFHVIPRFGYCRLHLVCRNAWRFVNTTGCCRVGWEAMAIAIWSRLLYLDMRWGPISYLQLRAGHVSFNSGTHCPFFLACLICFLAGGLTLCHQDRGNIVWRKKLTSAVRERAKRSKALVKKYIDKSGHKRVYRAQLCYCKISSETFQTRSFPGLNLKQSNHSLRCGDSKTLRFSQIYPKGYGNAIRDNYKKWMVTWWENSLVRFVILSII